MKDITSIYMELGELKGKIGELTGIIQQMDKKLDANIQDFGKRIICLEGEQNQMKGKTAVISVGITTALSFLINLVLRKW